MSADYGRPCQMHGKQSAASLPHLVASERLVLGMSSAQFEVRDAPMVDPLAARIVTDPTALDAAITLLDAVAQPMSVEDSKTNR
jgi:hypothetical protein